MRCLLRPAHRRAELLAGQCDVHGRAPAAGAACAGSDPARAGVVAVVAELVGCQQLVGLALVERVLAGWRVVSTGPGREQLAAAVERVERTGNRQPVGEQRPELDGIQSGRCRELEQQLQRW